MDQRTSMPDVSLNVGYYDPFKIFHDSLRGEFEKSSKLNTLHWKYLPMDSIKTIKNIKLNYIEEIPNQKNDIDPYLKFMFVTSQNVDEYRSRVRPLIKQWLNNIKSTKPNCMYFIILYENSELRSAADKFLKTNLLAKLKIDFVDDEIMIENIFKVKSTYSSPDEKQESWNLLSTSIKSGLIETINSKLSHYQSGKTDIIKNTKAAKVLNDIGQFDESLKCYNTLFSIIGNISLEDGFQTATEVEYPLFANLQNLRLKSQSNKFQQKTYFYFKQAMILLNPSPSEITIMRNLIEWMKLISSYINSIDESYKRNELSIILIDDFLSNESLNSILENSKRSLSELFEKLGELKLLKRNELIKLAGLKGYALKGTMIGISFEDPALYKLKYESIKQTLSSIESFQKAVIEMTEDIIRCYSNSQYKPKTIDTLSTELALIYFYNLKDYEVSLEILNDSFTYFESANWKYISLSILKVYIANLEKLTGTYDETVPILLTSYLDLISKDEFFEFEKFNKLLKNLSNEINIQNDQIFEAEMTPFLANKSVDTYNISIDLSSKINVTVDEIVLYLSNNEGDHMEFKRSNLDLQKTNQINLSTKHIVMGNFKADKLTFKIGKLSIVKSLSNSITTYHLESFLDGETLKSNSSIIALVPPVRDLHQDEIMLIVKQGSNGVQNCKVTFMKTDKDRLVPNSTFRVKQGTEDVEFELVNEEDRLIFVVNKKMDSNSELNVYIPYFFPPDVSNKRLRLKLGLSSNDEEYSQILTTEIDTQLQIAVSVQDIFKSSSLFSNFSINSAIMNKPIRIQEVQLISVNSEVKTWEQPKNIIAFNEQGSTFFYKIESLNDSSLNLMINYNDVQDEITEILNRLYLDELLLNNKELIPYLTLVRRIINQLKFKLNFYSLTKKIKIVGFDLEDFTNDLKLVPLKDLPKLAISLQKFIQKSDFSVNPSDMKHILNKIQKQLNINVSLSIVNTINIVEFEFTKQLQYLVCEPINTMLKLSIMIFEMEKKEKKKVRFSNEPSLPNIVTLKLDFIDHDNNWLVSGMKDFQVELNLEDPTTIANGKSFEFDLRLIPLKVGKLELPRVDVRNLSNFKIQMELDYKNSSESLLVVSELNKVTYSF